MKFNEFTSFKLSDSRSWTPRIINELVKGKKPTHPNESDLHLLPPKKNNSSGVQSVSVAQQTTEENAGNNNSIDRALHLIERTFFYSEGTEAKFKEIDLRDNIITQSLNYLFSNKYTEKCLD